MSTHKSPDVYVEEVALRPPSVVEVETAVPAFIGYTQLSPDDLKGKPVEVASMPEFEQRFGNAGATGAVVVIGDKNGALTLEKLEDPTEYYPLYFALRMFFDNGGAKCYVVSVGTRRAGRKAAAPLVPDVTKLKHGVDAVAGEDAVTLIVVPEAVLLSKQGYKTLTTAILEQCGRLRDRFAIFDVLDGGNATVNIESAREAFDTTPHLQHGAAYYPFIRTSLTFPYVERERRDAAGAIVETESNVRIKVNADPPVDLASIKTSNPARYSFAKNALQEHRVTLPPSAAVAGMYAAMDRTHGVWKAPTNTSLASVIAPVVAIDNLFQERLNVDPAAGKSINAIRAFAGKGTLVWGARTLAGNDNEWRYIPVRRFFNMVEESVTKSTRWVVFEPNDATTWVKVRGMIENYLTDKWRAGALVGTTPREAFFVKCGLGVTMTAQDILDGRLTVEIGMAVVRPAEFIIFRFSHNLQAA